MRIFSKVFLIFSFSLCAHAQKPLTILITSFEPFSGAVKNSTKFVSEIIQQQLGKKKFNVQTCVLPVVFDKATVIAKNCYEQMNPKPSLVISLGESGCNIKIETAAQNVDYNPSTPDNAGNIRVAQPILSGGPDSVSFDSFVADMYCSLSEKNRSKLEVSNSPGGFVCNNTAYQLGLYFQQMNQLYTFIHIPSHLCENEKSHKIAKKTVETLTEMIGELPMFRNKISFNQVCPILPATTEALLDYKNILQTLQDESKKKCGEEFIKKLGNKMGIQ